MKTASAESTGNCALAEPQTVARSAITARFIMVG
jgi:hypothetical protein